MPDDVEQGPTMDLPAPGHGQGVKVEVSGAGHVLPSEGPELAETGAPPPAKPDLPALYRDYFDFVWRSVRRLGVAEALLDDAVQDVFMVVHRQLPSYEPRRSPRSWLFSIARRVAADYRRSVRRKGASLPLPDELAGQHGGGPLRDALNKERSDVILAFLQSLDELHRDVFILCELEQLSAPEIADAVSASTSAVYSRIRTARQAFVKYVRDHHPDLMGEADG